MNDLAPSPSSLSGSNSGSKLDLAAVIFAMAFPTLITLIYFQWLNESESSLQQIAFGTGKIIQFAFPIIWVWIWHRSKIRCCPKADDERPSQLNSPQLEQCDSDVNTQPSASKQTSNAQIMIGIGFGIMVVVSMFACYFWLLEPTEIGNALKELVCDKVDGMNIDSFGKFLGMGIFYTLCHSFLEEYYWRWFVFDFLQKFVSTLAANILSSLGFMAHHVILLGFFFGWDSPLTYGLSFCIAIGGSVWAWQYKKTGSLLAPWISHMIVDAGIFLLGYFLVRSIL